MASASSARPNSTRATTPSDVGTRAIWPGLAVNFASVAAALTAAGWAAANASQPLSRTTWTGVAAEASAAAMMTSDMRVLAGGRAVGGLGDYA